MLDTAICISAAGLVFVLVCAEKCGHSKLEKLGLVLVLLGMAVSGSVATWFVIACPLENVANLSEVESVLRTAGRLLMVANVGLCMAIVGAGLVFVGATKQTWLHRRTLFPFLYRGRA